MKIVLTIFVLFFSTSVISNDDLENPIKYPIPEITNYPPSINGGYTATWGITQDNEGKIYFANSYGILIYDGKKWESVLLDNGFAARSIDIDNKGNILVGSLGDFGFISNNGFGSPKFVSLKQFLKDDYNSKDIIYETIALDDNDIFFRSNNKLFFYNDKSIHIVDKIDKKKFGVSRYLNKRLYITITGLGIAIFDDKKLKIIPNSEIFDDKTITGYHISDNNLIVFTRKSGVYKQLQDSFVKIENNLIDDITVIYRTYNLSNGKIGLATYEGFYIFNSKLEPQLYLDADSGLRDNNIRSVFEDKNGNIWLGLNDGISKINVNSKFKYFPKKSSNLIAKSVDLEIFNKHLYVATSSNLKKLVLNKDSKLKQTFVQVAKNELNTQVWSLYNLDSVMLVSSNDGVGQIDKNDQYSQLMDKKITGRVYEFLESKLFPKYLYIRAKNGIFFINKTDPGDYKLLFDKRASYIVENYPKKEIWFFVAKKGIHKINILSSDINKLQDYELTVYDQTYGIDIELTKIFKIFDNLIFKSKNNIFEFNNINQTFVNTKIFNSIDNIENKKILKIEKTENEKYWINTTVRIDGKRVQEFYELNKNFEVIKLPFNTLSHHLAIKFYFKDNLILMRGNEGIVIIESSVTSLNNNKSMISSIKNNDLSIHNLAPTKDLLNNKFKIKNLFNYDENKISFEVSLSDFRNENINKFRYKLEGLDKEYSNFTTNQIVTYTNLYPGNYIFLVEGFDSEGLLSKPSSYSFIISPPWWQTNMFYLIEFVLFSILLFITLFLRQSTKGVFIATSLTFMMILVVFEFINFLLDPLILVLSGGVPIFSIFSKVLLGLILLPLERIMNKVLDYFSKKLIFVKTNEKKQF
ncbi:hypothetical protein OAJ30_01025 [Alphaproteobacteria bacterium]|nr:hypothetical protein [Alphaproteobacteria bacterium]